MNKRINFDPQYNALEAAPHNRSSKALSWAIHYAETAQRRRFETRKDYRMVELFKGGLETPADPMKIYFQLVRDDFAMFDFADDCGMLPAKDSKVSGAVWRMGKWTVRFSPSFEKRVLVLKADMREDIWKRVASIAGGLHHNKENLAMPGLVPYTTFYILQIAGNRCIVWCTTVLGVGYSGAYQNAATAYRSFLWHHEYIYFCDIVKQNQIGACVNMFAKKLAARGNSMPDVVVDSGFTIRSNLYDPSSVSSLGCRYWSEYMQHDGAEETGVSLPIKYMRPNNCADNKEVLNVRKCLPRTTFRIRSFHQMLSLENILYQICKGKVVAPDDMELSEEELKVLHAWGSIVLLARSGCGKTTTAVLRLWRFWNAMKTVISETNQALCIDDDDGDNKNEASNVDQNKAVVTLSRQAVMAAATAVASTLPKDKASSIGEIWSVVNGDNATATDADTYSVIDSLSQFEFDVAVGAGGDDYGDDSVEVGEDDEDADWALLERRVAAPDNNEMLATAFPAPKEALEDAAAAVSTNNATEDDDRNSQSSQYQPSSQEPPIQWNPVFLTLSPSLCIQVQKTFNRLQSGEEKDENQVEEGMQRQHSGLSIDDDEVEDASNNNNNDDDEKENMEADDLLGNLPETMSQVKFQNFPMFVTLSRFLRMVDGSLRVPFFTREANGQIVGEGAKQGWNVEGQGVVNISARRSAAVSTVANFKSLGDRNEEEEADDADEYYSRSNSKKNNNNNNAPKQASQMIDYEYFAANIWPEISTGCANVYHPSLVWTEIMGFIKGSAESLDTREGFLMYDEYKSLGKRKCPTFLGRRKEIYALFLRYTAFKKEQYLYDQADLVFHIYSRIKHEQYRGVSIHAFFIDEVQDLPLATLRLLFTLCPQPNGFFVGGDTCQTIARGAAFRFADIRSLFFERAQPQLLRHVYSVPPIMQLTYNYRCHDELLLLGHSVVRLLEERFPESIDRLPCSMSKVHGPLPQILPIKSDDAILQLLSGPEQGATEFGAAQVVLVRNQQAKDTLPVCLRHALCLTVFEAKGLEFSDVILYNFFADSPASEDTWKVVNSAVEIPLFAMGEDRNRQAAATSTSPAPSSPSSKYRSRGVFETEFAELFGVEPDIVISATYGEPFVQTRHAILCSELKHLYAAVTRARHRLFILDKSLNAIPIFRYWLAHGLASIADPNILQAQESMTRPSSTSEWRKQGINLMKQGFYEAAMFCLERSGDDRMQARASAHMIAAKATRKMQEVMASTASGHKKAILAEINAEFKEAAQGFLASGHEYFAAKCLFSSGEYVQAAAMFQQAGRHRDAGFAFKEAGMHTEAAVEFEIVGMMDESSYEWEKAHRPEDALRVIMATASGSDPRVQKLVKKLATEAERDIKQNSNANCVDVVLQRLGPLLAILDPLSAASCVEEGTERTMNALLGCGIPRLCLEVAKRSKFVDRNSDEFLTLVRKCCWGVVHQVPPCDFADVREAIIILIDIGQVPTLLGIPALLRRGDYLGAAEICVDVYSAVDKGCQILDAVGWPIEDSDSCILDMWNRLPVLQARVAMDNVYMRTVATALFHEALRMVINHFPHRNTAAVMVFEEVSKLVPEGDLLAQKSRAWVSQINNGGNNNKGKQRQTVTGEIGLLWCGQQQQQQQQQGTSPLSSNVSPDELCDRIRALSVMCHAITIEIKGRKKRHPLFDEIAAFFGCCPSASELTNENLFYSVIKGSKAWHALKLQQQEDEAAATTTTTTPTTTTPTSNKNVRNRSQLPRMDCLVAMLEWCCVRACESLQLHLSRNDPKNFQVIEFVLSSSTRILRHACSIPQKLKMISTIATIQEQAALSVAKDCFMNCRSPNTLDGDSRSALLSIGLSWAKRDRAGNLSYHYDDYDNIVGPAFFFHVGGWPFALHEFLRRKSGMKEALYHSDLLDAFAYVDTHSWSLAISSLLNYNQRRWTSNDHLIFKPFCEFLYIFCVRALHQSAVDQCQVPASFHTCVPRNSPIAKRGVDESVVEGIDAFSTVIATLQREGDSSLVGPMSDQQFITEFEVICARALSLLELYKRSNSFSFQRDKPLVDKMCQVFSHKAAGHEPTKLHNWKQWCAAARERPAPKSIFRKMCDEVSDPLVPVSTGQSIHVYATPVMLEDAWKQYVLTRARRCIAGPRIARFMCKKLLRRVRRLSPSSAQSIPTTTTTTTTTKTTTTTAAALTVVDLYKRIMALFKPATAVWCEEMLLKCAREAAIDANRLRALSAEVEQYIKALNAANAAKEVVKKPVMTEAMKEKKKIKGEKHQAYLQEKAEMLKKRR